MTSNHQWVGLTYSTSATFVLSMLALGLSETPSFGEVGCNVQDYKAKSVGEISYEQQLSYLNEMTKDQYDEAKKSFSGSGSYGLITGSANYDDFRKRLNNEMHRTKLDAKSKYYKAWATTALDSSGLTAYLGCLHTARGFYLTVKALDKDRALLSVDWEPGLNGANSIPAPKVNSYSNIANISEVKATLGPNRPWISSKSLDIPIRKVKSNAPSDIQIIFGNESRVADIPPVLDIKPADSYEFRIDGVVYHSSSAFDWHDKTDKFQPYYYWGNISGIKGIVVHIIESRNGKQCAQADLDMPDGKPRFTFNEKTGFTDDRVDFGTVFKGGYNIIGAPYNNALQFFFDPKVDCPT